MSQYKIIKTDAKEYDALILCLTSESLLKYIRKIENELKTLVDVKTVLIDQLLITGNASNRFVKCEFSDGKLDLNTAQTVDPADRESTIKWLHNNRQYVTNSILTSEQRQNIKDNIPF